MPSVSDAVTGALPEYFDAAAQVNSAFMREAILASWEVSVQKVRAWVDLVDATAERVAWDPRGILWCDNRKTTAPPARNS